MDSSFRHFPQLFLAEHEVGLLNQDTDEDELL